MTSLESIKALALGGKKINAIKQLKTEYHQLGLKEAKDIVDALEDGSLSTQEAQERLKAYARLTAATEVHYESPSSTNSSRTLITKGKSGNTNIILIIIILILLGYIVFLKSS